MGLGSIESIGNAVHKYYFGNLNTNLTNLTATFAAATRISGVALGISALTYVNARIAGVKNPKGMILGTLGLGFTMPVMSLVTTAAFRSNTFAGLASGALQLGLGLWSFKQASAWSGHPVTYTEMATTTLIATAEVAIPIAICLK